MQYKNILITGGAGFVGSNLSIKLKKIFKSSNLIALDNLMRRGSELNISRLKEAGITFIHGDIRNKEDLNFQNIDLLVECSAEPSVLAGVNSSPEYLLNTNLIGAINCFELARRNKADVIFLSTSRVYPIKKINSLNFIEEKSRFSLIKEQKIIGASENGIAENFPLDGVRSLYGATKLSAEIILQEYLENYGIKAVINRCGVITGPWQMGKVDQGVIVLWLAKHLYQSPLSYIGFNGSGKQVRDFIHIDDLFNVLLMQINDLNKYNGEIYNIGGGLKNSFSLQELTKVCQEITGNKIKINKIKSQRAGDLRTYITDYKKFKNIAGWKPAKNLETTLEEIYKWIIKNKTVLVNILN